MGRFRRSSFRRVQAEFSAFAWWAMGKSFAEWLCSTLNISCMVHAEHAGHMHITAYPCSFHVHSMSIRCLFGASKWTPWNLRLRKSIPTCPQMQTETIRRFVAWCQRCLTGQQLRMSDEKHEKIMRNPQTILDCIKYIRSMPTFPLEGSFPEVYHFKKNRNTNCYS